MTQITVHIPDAIWRRVLRHYGLCSDHDPDADNTGTPADTVIVPTPSESGTETSP